MKCICQSDNTKLTGELHLLHNCFKSIMEIYEGKKLADSYIPNSCLPLHERKQGILGLPVYRRLLTHELNKIMILIFGDEDSCKEVDDVKD